MDRKECTICSCEEEQVSLVVAFARAFSLGAASSDTTLSSSTFANASAFVTATFFNSIGRGAYGMPARSRRGLKRSLGYESLHLRQVRTPQ